MRLSVILTVAALTLAGCNANELPNGSASVGPLRRFERPGSHPSGANKRLLRRPLTSGVNGSSFSGSAARRPEGDRTEALRALLASRGSR